MFLRFLEKLYLYLLLRRKLFKKFIIRSYNTINTQKDLYMDFFNHFDSRFHQTSAYLPGSASGFPQSEALLLNIAKGDKKYDFNNIYLLTDLDYKINNNSFNKLKIKKIKTTENLKREDINNSLFLILFNSDDLVIKHLKNINENNGFFKSLDIRNSKVLQDYTLTTSYRFVNINCLEALRKTFKQKNRISHFDPARLTTHENICEALELTKNVEGDYVEIGVMLGGSALTALNYLNLINLKKRVYLLDTYEGFNYEESAKSSDIVWHNTHLNSEGSIIDNDEKLKSHIRETLKEFDNYKLITNNICKDDLPKEINSISSANIDVDLYEATLQAIKKVSKKLSKNGIIICEDPVHTPNLYGALYAMEEFLKSPEGRGFIKIFKKNHYFLLKLN